MAGLGGRRAEPGACGRAAAGDGPAPGEDGCDRFGRDHRAAAGRPRRADRRAAAAIGELAAWAAHRHRRVATRTATKNQLLGQLDRCFPGLTLALPDVLGTKVGRLVAAEFADPHRLAALGVSRFVRFAAARGVRVQPPDGGTVCRRRPGCPAGPDAAVARQVLAADLALLADLDGSDQPRPRRSWPRCCR